MHTEAEKVELAQFYNTHFGVHFCKPCGKELERNKPFYVPRLIQGICILVCERCQLPRKQDCDWDFIAHWKLLHDEEHFCWAQRCYT